MTASLYKAMAAAFPKIEGALKDRNNPHFKAKYADLSSVVDAVKPALAGHGLFFFQMTHEQDRGVCVETFVGHESGESLSFGKLFVPAAKQDAQGYGSALTYARRYSLMTAFGVCPEDDDGNAATAAPKDKPEEMPDTEFARLAQLAKAAGVTSQALCKKYKVQNLRLLTQDQFSDACEGLSGLIAEKAKAESNILADELDDEIPGFD